MEEMLMMRPNLRLRIPSITGRHMLNSELKLVLINRAPLLRRHAVKLVSRVMPALLTSTSTGPRSASTCLRPRRRNS